MDIRKIPSFVLSFFFLCFPLNNHLSRGFDSISVNQSVSGEQTIISEGGNFELGFFKPGKSSYYYIGVWYKKISNLTIVWVANRETPIVDKYSSELKILDGNLVLVNESQIPVWSTNQRSTNSNSVMAVLLDDSNLVLREGFTSTETIWQSLDNPAHTWMPGGKLAYNKRTRTYNSITSWKNSEDPAPGLFSLTLDSNRGEILRWNGSKKYWMTGAWNGEFFSLVPESRMNNLNNFSYVDNENESYLTFSTYDPSFIFRFIVDVSGQFKVFKHDLGLLDGTDQWSLLFLRPTKQCDVYATCGPFGTCEEKAFRFCNCLTGFNPKSDMDWNLNAYSGGCLRKTQLLCGNTSTIPNKDRDKFVVYSNMRLPDHPHSLAVGSAKECEAACLNNCSCTAYAYEGRECSIWNGELLHLQQLLDYDEHGKTFHLRVAASDFRKDRTDNRITTGAIVGSVSALVLLALVCTVMWSLRRLVGTSLLLWANTFYCWLNFLHKERPTTFGGSLVAFQYKILQNATKNFSQKLGEGGFGSVFKGTLSDSTFIAVKKLKVISQGEKQFRAEVSTIGIIQHVNLVRLRGFCCEGNKKLLVYDYMQNGSLDSHLFDKNDSKVLDWKTRYQIALGTAQGLTYLHEKCRERIIHCDIKPENILLDAEFCPKITDFGLAKLVGREFSRVLTTMRGTIGYIAPEWLSGVPITSKADVYSYGMMLFEFISGRRNSEQLNGGRFKFFPKWATSVVIEGGDVLGLLDHRLERNADAEELRKICRVACWCIQDDENYRPTMGQIVQILDGVQEMDATLTFPRLFQALLDDQQSAERLVFCNKFPPLCRSRQP